MGLAGFHKRSHELKLKLVETLGRALIVLDEDDPVFHIFSALAEFDRTLARERTMAGRLTKNTDSSVGEICETLGISMSTFYHYVGPDREVRKGTE